MVPFNASRGAVYLKRLLIGTREYAIYGATYQQQAQIDQDDIF